MRKLVVMLALFLMLSSSAAFSANSNTLDYTSGTMLETSVYENNEFRVMLENEVETFSNTVYNLYEAGQAGKQVIMEVTPALDKNELLIKAARLKLGQMYILELKYVKIDGTYYSSYKSRIIPVFAQNQYGFMPIKGKIISDKIFEFQMSHPVKPTQAMLKEMHIVEDGETVLNGIVNTVKILHISEDMEYRVVCEVTSDFVFEYDKPYELYFGDDFISEYGTHADQTISKIILYRLEDWALSDVKTDMIKLNTNSIQFAFNQDMEGEAIVYATDSQNESIAAMSTNLKLDEKEQQSKLMVVFEQELQPGDIIHLSGLQSVLGRKNYSTTIKVTDAMQTEPIQIESFEMIDPVTFKLKLNQEIEPASLELIDLKMMTTGQLINREVKVHSLNVKPENPYFIQGILAPKSVFKSNTAYTLNVKGTLYNKSYVEFPVNQDLSFETLDVGQVKYRIDEAIFLDEQHILCRFTHPTVAYSNIEDYIKVVYDPDGRDDQLRIDSVDAWNDYMWVIGLDKASNMYDVFIELDNIYDVTGRYSINTSKRVVGPWD